MTINEKMVSVTMVKKKKKSKFFSSIDTIQSTKATHRRRHRRQRLVPGVHKALLQIREESSQLQRGDRQEV